jgi:hypothetical protein
MFKTMNRVVFDGMLGLRRCNGCSQFWVYWLWKWPAGKVLLKWCRHPLVFPWCLVYFGIDKVLPHLHINFKVSEGIKSPYNELLQSLNTVMSWSFFCWSNYISHWLNSEFSRRNCRSNAVDVWEWVDRKVLCMDKVQL